ncbi:hypothetical protein [Robertkochia solimangrovi]|uniref:hypothetical protein n=1 Tax=Robertkochia solimangrovi TaxID=2213046 RepID=UPI001F54BB5D|nr:hypothetical protein [Robertkochia solimangrovi]
MKKIFSIIVLLSATFMWGQVEMPKTPIKIEGGSNSTGTEKSMFNTDLLSRNNNSNATSLFSMDDADEFMKVEEFLDANRKFKKRGNTGNPEEEKKMGATTTQFLGDFRNNGKFVKIVCRDHQYVDGDRVRIIVNDIVVQPNVLLDATYRGIYVDLEKGFNKIEFQALNQGSSGPNTAALAVFDDQGQLISANEWNLSTGVKATMIIVKDN